MAPAEAFSFSRVTKFKKEFFELQNDQNFVSLRLFRDQVEYILTNYPTISLSQIALFLNKGLESVRYQKKAIQRGIVRNGRPKILAQNVEEDLSLYVTKCCELGLPPTISDIQNYLETKNDIYILADTLRKYYKRSDLYEVKKLAPIENERIQVKPEDINLYFNQLSATIDGMPASFVINLDESGFDKYADASKRYMIIPKGKIINNYGIDRNEKRVTLLGAICASGQTLKPLIIISRKSVDQELFELGFTPENVDYAYSETGYMTNEIFFQWIIKTLIPYVDRQRENINKYNQKCFLIMDNCSAHESEKVNELLILNGIFTIPLVSHSSDRTQMLDVGIFGNVKLNQQRIHPNKNLSTQSKQLIKLLGSWQATTHPLAVVNSFRECGINVIWDQSNNILITKVDRQGRKIPEEVQKIERPELSKTRININEIWTPQEAIRGNYETDDDLIDIENNYDIKTPNYTEANHILNELNQKIDEIINRDSDEDDDLYIDDLPYKSNRSISKHNKTNSFNTDFNTQQNLSFNNYQNFSFNNMQNFCFSNNQTCNIHNVQNFPSFNIPFSGFCNHQNYNFCNQQNMCINNRQRININNNQTFQNHFNMSSSNGSS